MSSPDEFLSCLLTYKSITQNCSLSRVLRLLLTASICHFTSCQVVFRSAFHPLWPLLRALSASTSPVDRSPFPSVPRHRGGRRRVLPVGAGRVTSSGVTSPRRRRAMFLQFPRSTARQLSTRQSDVRDIHRVAQNRAVSRC